MDFLSSPATMWHFPHVLEKRSRSFSGGLSYWQVATILKQSQSKEWAHFDCPQGAGLMPEWK